MRWPWQERRNLAEDRERLAESERELQRIEAQWPRVREMVETLRRHQERNHFADAITDIFRGGDR